MVHSCQRLCESGNLDGSLIKEMRGKEGDRLAMGRCSVPRREQNMTCCGSNFSYRARPRNGCGCRAQQPTEDLKALANVRGKVPPP
jgi:hypothetical protein